ncbi:MAG: long-chain fatty acid--CoA ligase [Candidatus Hodarchaeota archaeon]
MDLPEYIKNRHWKGHLPEGVPLELEIPENISLCDLFEKYTEEYKNKTFIIYDNKEYTYKHIQELTLRFSNALLKLGVKKGDVVALWLSNCPQFIISYFASLFVGGTVTAISPLYTEREGAYQIKDSGAKFLVSLDRLLTQYQGFENNLSLEKVILVNLDGITPFKSKTDKIVNFNTLLEQNPHPIPPPEVKFNSKKDIAVIQYTGGTTGVPRGAALSHYNLVANSLQLKQVSDYLKEEFLKEDIVSIFVLPWYHIFGQIVELVSALFIGSKAFVLGGFDIEKIFEIMKTHKPNSLFGVPTMYIKLLNSSIDKNVDISCLKSTHTGATPMPVETAKEWEKRTGFALGEGYGLSEASPAVANSPPWAKKKPGSCGHPLPNTLVGIINEQLEFLPIEHIGELVVSGPQVMVGYHNRPEENKKVFLNAGGYRWLRTGDLAKIDEEGYIYILDRIKDMIKYKGHSVYPREVEEVLFEHPAVLECCVVGVEDPIKGENIKVYIVLREQFEDKISEQEIINWAKENMTAYKYPRIVEFVKDLPKSPAGKVLRRRLRENEGKWK